PSRPPSGSYFCYLFTAGNLIPYPDKILVVVPVQHLTAILGLNHNSISIAFFFATLNDLAGGNGPNGGTQGRRNIGPGMVLRLSSKRIAAPTFRRTDHTR